MFRSSPSQEHELRREVNSVSEDALDHKDVSTEWVAGKEDEKAAEADKDKAYERTERHYEGKWKGQAETSGKHREDMT